ncbi:UNVERIFIED_CONTAM: hypothetical protein RMT77_015757 [Armadillidium vulgare]
MNIIVKRLLNFWFLSFTLGDANCLINSWTYVAIKGFKVIKNEFSNKSLETSSLVQCSNIAYESDRFFSAEKRLKGTYVCRFAFPDAILDHVIEDSDNGRTYSLQKMDSKASIRSEETNDETSNFSSKSTGEENASQTTQKDITSEDSTSNSTSKMSSLPPQETTASTSDKSTTTTTATSTSTTSTPTAITTTTPTATSTPTTSIPTAITTTGTVTSTPTATSTPKTSIPTSTPTAITTTTPITSIPSTTSTTTTTTSTSTSCVQVGDPCNEIGKYYLHRETCEKYLICQTTYKVIEKDCAPGTHFDKSKVCKHPNDVLKPCKCT